MFSMMNMFTHRVNRVIKEVCKNGVVREQTKLTNYNEIHSLRAHGTSLGLFPVGSQDVCRMRVMWRVIWVKQSWGRGGGWIDWWRKHVAQTEVSCRWRRGVASGQDWVAIEGAYISKLFTKIRIIIQKQMVELNWIELPVTRRGWSSSEKSRRRRRKRDTGKKDSLLQRLRSDGGKRSDEADEKASDDDGDWDGD